MLLRKLLLSTIHKAELGSVEEHRPGYPDPISSHFNTTFPIQGTFNSSTFNTLIYPLKALEISESPSVALNHSLEVTGTNHLLLGVEPQTFLRVRVYACGSPGGVLELYTVVHTVVRVPVLS